MSNSINTIHYAVEIRSTSTKSSANVGLFEGVFRFVTDNYDMNNAVDEDAVPITNPDYWYKDFITKNGVSKVSSQLDITVGGDQAYLSSSSVELINYTDLGYRYHDALAGITGLYPIASEMIIYAIVDDVMSPRWTGVVSNAMFTDEKFKWVGADKNNEDNDTLSGDVFGYVDGVPAEYTGDIKSIWKDLFVNDFGANDTVKAGYSSSSGDILSMPYSNADEYTGFVGITTVSEITYLLPNTSERYVSCENGEDYFGNIAVNDYLTFNDSNDRYIIREIIGGTLIIDALDASLVDFEQMFRTAPDPRYRTTVEETLADPIDANILSVWKQQTLNVDATNLPDSSTITIIHDDGGTSTVNYTLNDDGGVLLGRQVTTNKIAPTNVKYFTSDVELFVDEYKTPDDEWYDDIEKTDVILENDLDIDSSFVEFQGTYNYFELDFDPDADVSNHSFSLMLQGVLKDSVENWQQELEGDNNDWDSCTGGTWGDGTEPFYGRMTYANNAKDISERTAEIFTIKVFKLSNVAGIGSIPVLDSVFEMPNTRKAVVSERYTYSPWSTGPFGPIPRSNFSIKVTNVPVTNIPYYGGDVLSTYDNTLVKQNGTDTINLRLPITYGILPESSEELKLKDGSKYLIQITGNNINDKYLKFTDEFDVTTSRVESEIIEDCVFSLNGFSLTSVEELFDNSSSFNYVAQDLATTTYPNTVEALVGTKDTIINRDSWVTGKYIDTPTPRHNLLTSMMKQGFVAGYVNRFGNYQFKSFLEDFTSTPHQHNDDLILSDSLKAFTMTPLSKVYNEFNLKWNYSPVLDEYKNGLVIKDAKEDFFPAEAGDWTSFVSGIPNYANAKEYWNRCHIAYLTNKIINKAPDDRTELEWAVDDSDNKPLPLGTGTGDVNLETINPAHFLDNGTICYLRWDAPLTVGGVVTLVSETETYTTVVKLTDITPDPAPNSIRIFTCTILEWNGPTGTLQTIDSDSALSTVIIDVDNWISLGEYSAVVYKTFEELSVSTGTIEFGSSVDFFYYDKVANIGDTVLLPCYYNVGLDDYTIDVYVTITESTYTPNIDPQEPQGTVIGTVVEIGEFPNNSDQSVVYYNPRFPSFVDKLGVEDLTGYPWEYLKLMVDWTTYQKYQANYSLPITAETIKYELMDNVIFQDPIITPNGQIGRGWITKYVLDPKKDIINIQLTFDTEFLITASIPVCDYIDEAFGNVDYIDEDVNNTDSIEESFCPYN